jgi:hypothetical protein
MDLIGEKLIGKELREIQHKARSNTVVLFEDGAITALTEVRIDIAFADDPIRVTELIWNDEWVEIIFDAGIIRTSRIPTWPSAECLIYGSAGEPRVMIVDRGEE